MWLARLDASRSLPFPSSRNGFPFAKRSVVKSSPDNSKALPASGSPKISRSLESRTVTRLRSIRNGLRGFFDGAADLSGGISAAAGGNTFQLPFPVW